MVGLFALHISIFVFLGLFFSSRVSNAITSLVGAFANLGMLGVYLSESARTLCRHPRPNSVNGPRRLAQTGAVSEHRC